MAVVGSDGGCSGGNGKDGGVGGQRSEERMREEGSSR